MITLNEDILEEELERLYQLDKMLTKECSVCKVSFDKEQKYKARYCLLNILKTACSLSVQRRCNKITKLADKLDYEVWKAIVAVEQELKEFE